MSTATTSTNRQTFRALVAEVATRAKARLPEAVNGRIESAVKLVLLHDVVPQEDGSILAGSSTDPLQTYRLVGTACECQDFQHGRAPEGWCKHRIAAAIAKRVAELLPADAAVGTLPAPHPASQPCPEAAFSLTLKGTVDGYDALLTARGMTVAEFQRNLAAVRGVLDPPMPALQGKGVRNGR
jgi:hypothetical protein